MRRAPCAMLITRMTPKIRVSPDASRAYTPPISRPRMRVWMDSVTPRRPRAFCGASATRPAESHPFVLLRPPSRDDLLRRRRLVRQHDLRHSALPLTDEELAFGSPLIIPAERSQDGVDRVLPQPIGQLDLTVSLDR